MPLGSVRSNRGYFRSCRRHSSCAAGHLHLIGVAWRAWAFWKPNRRRVVPRGVIDKGLKKGVLGFVSSVVIGVASTAPGYSLAASLGLVVAVAGLGLQAPAVMLLVRGRKT